MEEVQKEVRQLLLGFGIRCACQRLCGPCGLARDRQHYWGPKEVEWLFAGRARALKLYRSRSLRGVSQLATAFEMGLPGVQEPDHVVPKCSVF